MTPVHLDTHVVLWLYEGLVAKLAPAREHLEGQPVALSPMAFLELEYLHEIGRSRASATVIVSSLAASIGLAVVQTAWEPVARTAAALTWTRDPFDRLIAAHAITDGAPLVTADQRLRTHCPNAVWG